MLFVITIIWKITSFVRIPKHFAQHANQTFSKLFKSEKLTNKSLPIYFYSFDWLKIHCDTISHLKKKKIILQKYLLTFLTEKCNKKCDFTLAKIGSHDVININKMKQKPFESIKNWAKNMRCNNSNNNKNEQKQHIHHKNCLAQCIALNWVSESDEFSLWISRSPLQSVVSFHFYRFLVRNFYRYFIRNCVYI